MGRKLTLVVTCTDRKSAQPVDSLRVRNLPRLPLAERAENWLAALDSAADRRPLRRLYQGESWTQVLRLEAAAVRSGFEPELLVASAGLGLVSAEVESPAYAATFSPRQLDSVGVDADQNRKWWASMTSDAELVRSRLDEQALIVLSESYASAMAPDLAGLEGREDVVVFGGSREVPDDVRIPADRNLRATLGGTTSSLNLRTAIAWLEHLSGPTLVGHRNHRAWRSWVDGARRPEPLRRSPLSDAQILDCVLSLRRTEPEISRTRALRALRDSGLACEQKRFGRLFDSAVEGA